MICVYQKQKREEQRALSVERKYAKWWNKN